MNIRRTFVLLAWAILLPCLAVAQTTPVPAPAPTPEPTVAVGTRLSVLNAKFPVTVLVEGPSEAPGELQVICLFSSKPENKLLASLAEMDQKLGGLLTRVRTAGLFRGDLGETMLLTPKPGVIGAKRLLIFGLGDRTTFTADREELVGEIVYAESDRLGVAAPNYAPTIIDGGFTGTDTGGVGAKFIAGFLRGRDVAAALHAVNAGPMPRVASLTFLAGPAHAADTQKGITAALNAK
jgi:hypothetical protein